MRMRMSEAGQNIYVKTGHKLQVNAFAQKSLRIIIYETSHNPHFENAISRTFRTPMEM